MALYNSFPPQRLLSSRQIAPSQALELLSAYLEAATTEAYLQPNALLTEGGPVSATSGPNVSLTLHNLKRVEAGLRGEHLSAEILFANSAHEILPDVQSNDVEGEIGADTPALSKKNGHQNDHNIGIDGWQDKLDFEREQDVTQGEVGDRLYAMTEIHEEDVEVPQVQATRSGGDNEARKRRKKERRQAEKVMAAKKKEAESKKGRGE
ncbi:hypothetical protein MMC13_006603 [Lambiella insularis]|nr:hypothetical protein [Lambiella insularis]